MDTTLARTEPESMKLCRCCMKVFGENDLLQSLFEFTTDEMEIPSILQQVASITVTRNDGIHIAALLSNKNLNSAISGFPQKICVDCKNQAVNAYHFRQMCISTDENLRFNRKPLNNNE